MGPVRHGYDMSAAEKRAASILIVDDDELVLSSLRGVFSLQTDYNVLEATDPKKAIGLVERTPLDVVISDFLMPVEHITAVFQALASHDVVPVMVTLSSEIKRLPRWGLVSLADLETGKRRLVLMRQALREAWRAHDEARRGAFRAIANRYGRKPFEIVDRIDWDRLGAQLMGGGG